MDRAKLIEGYRKIVKTIYSPRQYYQRMCEFLNSYTPCRKRKLVLSPPRIRALLKSIFYIGILGNGVSQWYYWRIFFKSIFSYPHSFQETITLMVYGYHFRKIAKKI